LRWSRKTDLEKFGLATTSGVVKDTSGALLPGVTVAVTNVASDLLTADVARQLHHAAASFALL
jgi:hypothetical protein